MVWTKVAGNETAVNISDGDLLHLPVPTLHTKVLCHNPLQSEVYSIHYIPTVVHQGNWSLIQRDQTFILFCCFLQSHGLYIHHQI